MIATTIGRLQGWFPGLAVCFAIAAAASFMAEHYGAPVMLFALLLGMAMNFLADVERCQGGIEAAARDVLRVGVAMLGVRITFGEIAALGWEPAMLVVGSVLLTIVVSMVAARMLGFQALFGLLSGGATAICGASAALAISAALPRRRNKDRATLFTIIGVSTLSTLAMIAYPVIVQAIGLDPTEAGIFLGGTIHDVAQVVGAGYSIGQETGDAATVVKLMRVAMLLPVIVGVVLITREQSGTAEGEAPVKRPPLLPWFAVVFILLAGVNSTGVLPVAVQSGLTALSQWCLIMAMAAIGMKSRLQELISLGPKPVLLMIGETLFLATLVAAALRWWI